MIANRRSGLADAPSQPSTVTGATPSACHLRSPTQIHADPLSLSFSLHARTRRPSQTFTGFCVAFRREDQQHNEERDQSNIMRRGEEAEAGETYIFYGRPRNKTREREGKREGNRSSVLQYIRGRERDIYICIHIKRDGHLPLCSVRSSSSEEKEREKQRAISSEGVPLLSLSRRQLFPCRANSHNNSLLRARKKSLISENRHGASSSSF